MKKGNEETKKSNEFMFPEGTLFNIDTVEFRVKNAIVDIDRFNSKHAAYIQYGETHARLTNRTIIKGFENRHNLCVRYGIDSSELHVSGSPYAFLYGQNVYTSPMLKEICVAALRLLKSEIKLRPEDLEIGKQWVAGDIDLDRVDIAVNFVFSSTEEAEKILRQMGRQLVNHRGSMGKVETSVYWSPQWGKRYQIAAYAKGPQMVAKERKDKSLTTKRHTRLIKHCAGMLRIEVRLRRAELVALNLATADRWKKDTPEKIFKKYFKRLKILNVLSEPLNKKELTNLRGSLRPVLALAKCGIDLNDIYAKRTVARHRSEFSKLGIDLMTPWRKKKALPLLDYLQSRRHAAVRPAWLST